MKLFAFAVCVIGMTVATGCRDSSESKSDGSGRSKNPPHGGTPVLVAAHKYHLELVRDGNRGVIQAYVLAANLHDFIPVPETNFTLRAMVSRGQTEHLEFQRVTNSTTATLADPSFLFEGRAEWVKVVKNFDGLIPAITVKGATFTNISFPFPEGTQHTH
jgi:hypothetical protein